MLYSQGTCAGPTQRWVYLATAVGAGRAGQAPAVRIQLAHDAQGPTFSGCPFYLMGFRWEPHLSSALFSAKVDPAASRVVASFPSQQQGSLVGGL